MDSKSIKYALDKKNRMVNFHTGILTSKQKKVLQNLAPVVSTMGYYLGGGTAIALHLGHRRSVDFDWFTKQMSMQPIIVAKEIREQSIPLMVKSVEEGTLHGSVGGVKVSLFEFKYPMLRRAIPWKEFGCNIASLEDLACMKLAAIVQRGSKKDFVDIFALLKNVFTLEQMLKFYKKKFEIKESAHVLYALSYLDDAENEPMPEMIWESNWKQMKSLIQKSIIAISKR